jgi:hypothetical protein
MTKFDLIIFVCEKFAFLFVLENHFVDIPGLVVLRHRILIPVHSGKFKLGYRFGSVRKAQDYMLPGVVYAVHE